jgi:N6-L-threonylcarbamoyladenine synthase
MQQLSERNHIHTLEYSARSRLCDPALNSPDRVRGGVPGLKTSDNNPDAALTATAQAGQDLRVPVVYVLNMRGKPLMPCKPQKARKLLKHGKAKAVKRTPFTIQLKYATGEAVQPVTLGVDSGFKNIGLSAVSGTQELYAAEIKLRDDMVKLNSERRQYRRARRHRKTWHRKPRFLNRGNKSKGWLAPSIRNKLDAHVKAVNQVKQILPVDRIIIEVAAFDIQKIKTPDIRGEQYQQGEQLGFWNVREYVLHRDGHKCLHCKGKSKDPVLNVHHIESRQIGGDRPDNLMTLCETCHKKHHRGEIKLKIKASNGFKAETFMTMIRWMLVNRLQEAGNAVSHTYGHITKHRRIRLKIQKTHANDAFVIAGGNGQTRSPEYTIKQVRKCNRKLFKGIRSHIRNTAPRHIKGFQRFDKVLFKGVECFIFGRRATGYFDLRKLDGAKVHASARSTDCILLESARTFLTERRDAVSSPA